MVTCWERDKADVAGPAEKLVENAFRCVPFTRFGSFFFELTSDFIHETLRMPLIDLAKVLKQAVTEIWVMGRVARKPSTTKAQTSLHRRAV